jgi:hypothetical protein
MNPTAIDPSTNERMRREEYYLCVTLQSGSIGGDVA